MAKYATGFLAVMTLSSGLLLGTLAKASFYEWCSPNAITSCPAGVAVDTSGACGGGNCQSSGARALWACDVGGFGCSGTAVCAGTCFGKVPAIACTVAPPPDGCK